MAANPRAHARPHRAYADSKTLNEEKRERLIKQVQADGNLVYGVDVLSAADISAQMLSRCGTARPRPSLPDTLCVLAQLPARSAAEGPFPLLACLLPPRVASCCL